MSPKPKSAVRSELDALKRDVLPQGHAEPSIKPVWIDWDLARETRVFSGTEAVLSLNMEQIKRESPEHHQIIYDLLVLLHKMASVARDAVPVARVQLETVQRLAEQEVEAIKARKKQAKEERDRQNLYREDLQKEVLALREKHPDWYADDIRAVLKDKGVSKKVLRALKIPRRRTKLPRP